MQPSTFNNDTELSAVNSVLASIGQSPITTLNFENPEISFVYKLIQEANVDIQNEGWVFNTERNYPLTPSEGNEIIIPVNVLRMDVTDNAIYRTSDVVKRQGKLYDKMRHSYEFTETVHVDIVWLFDFSDLAPVYQRYIVSKASTRAATQMVANKELAALLATQESFARAACMEYECNQGDYTIFGTPDGTSYRPYQPYRALNRQ